MLQRQIYLLCVCVPRVGCCTIRVNLQEITENVSHIRVTLVYLSACVHVCVCAEEERVTQNVHVC